MRYKAAPLPAWPKARALLAANRVSHRRLAEAAGLSPATISRYLCGRKVPGEIAAYRLSAAFRELGLLQEVSL